jgi:predicted ATPase
VDAESGLSYSGLTDLLGGWIETTAPTLLPPQRRALEIALLQADSGGEPLEQHAVGRAVLAVVRLLAAETPVLIAVDDAQWLDSASASALAFAVRRLAGARVGLLATWRASEGLPPLQLQDAMPPARQHRLVVGPLHPNDLAELVDQRFPGTAPRTMRSRVITAAAGNTLYAIELVAAHLTSDRSVEDSLTLPTRLEELLAARLERLPQVVWLVSRVVGPAWACGGF